MFFFLFDSWFLGKLRVNVLGIFFDGVDNRGWFNVEGVCEVLFMLVRFFLEICFEIDIVDWGFLGFLKNSIIRSK